MQGSRYGVVGMLLAAMFTLGFSVEYGLFERPQHFPNPAYDFAVNPLRPATIALGRRLFYEEALSADSTVSCASCHSPYNAFAHTDHDLSHGINDSVGRRNAPPLFNLAWSTSFHRDGAHHSLELQPLAPLHDPVEMANSIGEVVARLGQDKAYRSRFAAAWGDSLATGERVLKSLAQFQLTLVSAGAKYDRVMEGQAAFSEQEEKGYALFQRYCNGCHTEPLFTNQGFARNGLEVDTSLNDFGRMEITSLPKDSLLFKVPSLRNLSFTYPYMHDGRFRKLRSVLEHYASRIDDPLPLTSDERTDLISFLLTLNDREFVFNTEHGFIRE